MLGITLTQFEVAKPKSKKVRNLHTQKVGPHAALSLTLTRSMGAAAVFEIPAARPERK